MYFCNFDEVLLTILLKSIDNTNINTFLVLLKHYQYFDRSVFNINHAVTQPLNRKKSFY